jgi:hypothetical protein
MQRDVTALEDRPGADREVNLALIAAVETSLARRDAIPTRAGRASRSLGPETAFEVCPGRLFVREHLKQFERANSRSTHLRLQNILRILRCIPIPGKCSKALNRPYHHSAFGEPYRPTFAKDNHYPCNLDSSYKNNS